MRHDLRYLSDDYDARGYPYCQWAECRRCGWFGCRSGCDDKELAGECESGQLELELEGLTVPVGLDSIVEDDD